MGDGDRGNVTNRPPAPSASDLGRTLSDAGRAVGRALEEAKPFLEMARPLFEARRAADTYSPRHSPSDHLAEMRRFIVFRPGRAFEVAAMGEKGSGTEQLAKVIRDGRMIAVPSRGGEEKTSRAGGTDTAGRAVPTRVAGNVLSKDDLSLFERIFMARFEGGIPVGEKLEKGQFQFLAKSEKAWAEFFQKFLPFLLEKKVNLGEVEMLVFRGLLKDLPKGQPGEVEKAPALFMISDMKFLDGKTDKFARLQIQGRELAQAMAEHQPGDVLGKTVLIQIAESFGGGEFPYLSLSHRIVNPEMVDKSKNPIAEAYRTPEQMKEMAIREGTREVSQGIALSARTEQLIAERLDIPLREGLKQTRAESIGPERQQGEGQRIPAADLGGLGLDKWGKKKKKGMFGEGYEEGGAPIPYVPWWLAVARPMKFKGKPRWWVPFLYFLAASGAALAAVYVFRSWMVR